MRQRQDMEENVLNRIGRAAALLETYANRQPYGTRQSALQTRVSLLTQTVRELAGLILCRCGSWPLNQYGDICPSCGTICASCGARQSDPNAYEPEQEV